MSAIAPNNFFTQKTLPFSWGELAFYEGAASQGSEPAVLFLHGNGCDFTDWEAVRSAWPGTLLPHFAGMDFRAHGHSSTPREFFTLSDLVGDVWALLDHLQLPRVVLAGHSLGGMVGIEAAHHPSVCGLVLVEGWTKLDRAGAFDHGRHMFGNLSDERKEDVKKRGGSYRARLSDEAWEHYWSSVEAFDGTASLNSLKIPILEVYGTAGKQAEAEKFLNVPQRVNIRWHWVEGAGHFLPQERPGEIAEIIAEFHKQFGD